MDTLKDNPALKSVTNTAVGLGIVNQDEVDGALNQVSNAVGNMTSVDGLTNAVSDP